MATKRWSDRTDFTEVASPYAVKELMRDRLGGSFTVTDFKGPHDNGSGTLDVFHEKTQESTTFRYHCPESYERLVRLARNIASTTGHYREGAQEA
ncbi:MAG: hypothetical protein ACYTBJ_02420 [Planctomycetota bacterium]|jgi:hypothetical protein